MILRPVSLGARRGPVQLQTPRLVTKPVADVVDVTGVDHHLDSKSKTVKSISAQLLV